MTQEVPLDRQTDRSIDNPLDENIAKVIENSSLKSIFYFIMKTINVISTS